MDNPLELILTKDLLKEVFSRFDYAVFGGEMIKEDDTETSDGVGMTRIKWEGGYHSTVGLLEEIKFNILQNRSESRWEDEK